MYSKRDANVVKQNVFEKQLRLFEILRSHPLKQLLIFSGNVPRQNTRPRKPRRNSIQISRDGSLNSLIAIKTVMFQCDPYPRKQKQSAEANSGMQGCQGSGASKALPDITDAPGSVSRIIVMMKYSGGGDLPSYARIPFLNRSSKSTQWAGLCQKL